MASMPVLGVVSGFGASLASGEAGAGANVGSGALGAGAAGACTSGYEALMASMSPAVGSVSIGGIILGEWVRHGIRTARRDKTQAHPGSTC